MIHFPFHYSFQQSTFHSLTVPRRLISLNRMFQNTIVMPRFKRKPAAGIFHWGNLKECLIILCFIYLLWSHCTSPERSKHPLSLMKPVIHYDEEIRLPGLNYKHLGRHKRAGNRPDGQQRRLWLDRRGQCWILLGNSLLPKRERKK